MKVILNFISNINICYLMLKVLFLIASFVFLKDKSITKQQKWILLGVYLLITVISFSYFNGIVSSIFQLKYLNAKLYLIMLVIANAIMLYTMNHSVLLGYKILNYLLFVSLLVVFGAIVSIVFGNEYHAFYLMDISNAVIFMDLSFVIFMIYLFLFLSIYIVSYLLKIDLLKRKEIVIPHINFSKWKIPSFLYKKEKKTEKANVLTPEELLSHRVNDLFYINGEECSIIFEDSNQENIVKNYYILMQDIHAKLMNGYTLEENRMFKSICLKLHVGNLRRIDLNNVSILNQITVDEYNLLKRVFETN